jgi:hypothetical protein
VNQSPSTCPDFPKYFGKDIAREDVEEGDVSDVEEDIDQEHKNTRSFVSEVAKWKKMRQAGIQRFGRGYRAKDATAVCTIILPKYYGTLRY